MPVQKHPSTSGELFPSERTRPAQPEKSAVTSAHIDGGSRGNPGPAGYGVLLEDHQGQTIARLSCYLGRQTNNFAEYSGLVAALDYALEHGLSSLHVYSDSELLVFQIRGRYKVRNPGLRPLYERALALIRDLQWFRIEHVRREGNHEADRLANQAMDAGMRNRDGGTGL
ncbi:MAG: ribonuclease HI family protein [Terriglobales bacterium]|jgi:ribonuclease HI